MLRCIGGLHAYANSNLLILLGVSGRSARRQIQRAQPVELLDFLKQRIEGDRAWIGA
jgi:hypothetical protein